MGKPDFGENRGYEAGDWASWSDGSIDQEAYIEAAMVLRRGNRLESDYQKK